MTWGRGAGAVVLVLASFGCGQSKAWKSSAPPGTNVAFTEFMRTPPEPAVDVLLTVDSSLSMAQKQELLADAIAHLVHRLTNPRCLLPGLEPSGVNADPEGRCPSGSGPERRPVRDLHVGVITSSLGSHGGELCADGLNDDRAELVPSVNTALRGEYASYEGLGFLAWDPREPSGHEPPAETDAGAFVASIHDHVLAAGTGGCSLSAPLEAWYRFLIDPEPVRSVTNNGTSTVRGPVNDVVLAQRAAFLRPESLVAIVMLSDRNDCSIADEAGTQGWLVTYVGEDPAFRMPRARTICADDPNDPRCAPCSAGDADPGCALGQFLPAEEDPLPLRCFDHKRRFGVDLLYPTSRYVEALTESWVDARLDSGVSSNPLFTGTATTYRDDSSVFLVGILGVPWQDLATDESVTGDGLVYLDGESLEETGRWEWILGVPSQDVPPEPFMLESVGERQSGLVHPGLPELAIAPSTSTTINPVNGHEHASPTRDELQYACIFPISPVTCSDENADTCECNAAESAHQRPLCRYPDGTSLDGEQHFDKAYPSVRQLEVLRGVGPSAVVGSACPKVIDPESASHGYRPVMEALLDRLTPRLGHVCLRDALPVLESGIPSCRLVETTRTGPCGCEEAGRAKVSGDVAGHARHMLLNNAYCGGVDQVACDKLCLCEILPFTGDDLAACQSTAEVPSAPGYCYLDADHDPPLGDPALVMQCAPGERRRFRFAGTDTPKRDAVVVIACSGPREAP